MLYKDQLALTGSLDEVGTPIRENIGESSRLGIEIEIKASISDNWFLQPNLSISKNTNKNFYFKRDGVLTYLGNTKLSYSPELVFGNILSYNPSNNFGASLLTKFVGEQYMSNIESKKSKLESYYGKLWPSNRISGLMFWSQRRGGPGRMQKNSSRIK